MKRIFLTFAILTGLCTACKDGADFLDPASSTGLTKEIVFNDSQYSERYLIDLYARIRPVLPRTDGAGGRWRDNVLLDGATEHGSYNKLGGWDTFNHGSWGPQSPASGGAMLFSTAEWTEHYAAIRACNLYLENADKIPLNAQNNYNEALRKIRKAEAKWLLAFNYAELAKMFGGVPLITEILDAENVQIPRSSYDETIALIVKLCDEAAADLPLKHVDADLGRATKGAALALKARMLLYAASLLWNDPAHPTASPAHGAYDPSKWKKAASAAADVIKLGVYDLHPDLSTLFNTRTNNEIIFARMMEPMSYYNNIAVPYKLYIGSGAYVLGGFNQVTFNLLKHYEVLKGGVAYSIDDPASGYNSQDPYKNRDPRFYRDNIYNGTPLKFGTTTTRIAEFGDVAPGVNKSPAHNLTPHIYNTYVHNVKFADLTLNITWDGRNPAGGTRTNQNYAYFRYAEMLLNYAEAMNESDGNNVDTYGTGLTALAAINRVRERAKYVTGKPEYLGYSGRMPPIASGLNQTQFRDKLRHERKIEFCWEEHWFWDFRRWMLTPETDIKGQIPVWTSPTTVSYVVRTIDTRVWEPKMFRMPIPDTQILLNPSLVQNPGW